jgi:glycosyltransferase involved in cell wall biosynthesis
MGPDVDDVPQFYHDQIKKMGLESVVTIRPPVRYEEVPDEILSYDIALAYVPDHPVDWRYHPTLKVLEYRALGIPIIATDFPPNREVVEEGVNGMLLHNSPENWAEAMLRFMVERDFLEACQTNAQKMRRGTTWDEIAELYTQKIYDRLTKASDVTQPEHIPGELTP